MSPWTPKPIPLMPLSLVTSFVCSYNVYGSCPVKEPPPSPSPSPTPTPRQTFDKRGRHMRPSMQHKSKRFKRRSSAVKSEWQGRNIKWGWDDTCGWMTAPIDTWMNRADVKLALNIPDEIAPSVKMPKWRECVDLNYTMTVDDLTPVCTCCTTCCRCCGLSLAGVI